MPTETVFATAKDGWVLKADSSSWATTQSAATGQIVGDVDTNFAFCESGFTTPNYRIQRGFLIFDISASSIPTNAEILSATPMVYVTGKDNDDNDGDDYVNVFEGTQAATLTTADYDAFNSTALASSIDIGDITTSAYNSWPLNASGIAIVQAAVGGTLKLCFREGHDVENNAYAGATGTVNRITIDFSEQGGTSTDPKIEITYRVPSTGFFSLI